MTRITDVHICVTRSQWSINYSSDAVSLPRWCMMTSSNGDIFRVTDPLYGEFTGDRWFPRTKASDAKLIFSLICTWTNRWVILRRHRAHYDVTVMARMWRLSLCSSLTPYNITFPFGTFINTCQYVVQYRLILKRCLQLHVEGVYIRLHLTHVYFHNTLTSSTYI